MNGHLAHIADRVLNRPLLIMPEKLAVLAQVLEGKISIEAPALSESMRDDIRRGLFAPVDASRYVGDFAPLNASKPNGSRKPYRTTVDGVAIIPVIGSLVNRGGWLDAMSGLTSYEKLKFQISEAARDHEVSSIVLDFDSPGGEAVGAFEVADVVRIARNHKEVVAVVSGLMCSAGYAIGCAASRIYVGPSSVIGSIGVVMLHLDRSRRLNNEGITPTLIFAGARKVDGNPYEKLAPEVKLELQAEIDGFYELFIEYVARGRHQLSPEEIRSTEARTFLGRHAVNAGLADEVGTIDTVMSTLPKRMITPRAMSAAEKSTKYLMDHPAPRRHVY